MLLSLITASPVSGLQQLDIRYMAKGDDKATFYFAKLHQSCRKGKPPSSLTITGFPEESQLCVIETLDTHLDRTKDRRLGKSQLLLSFQRPCKEVVSITISGWIKKVLKLAKIDTDIYKAHSTCSASTSNVKLKGLSLADILKRGLWSRNSTWQRFYNKDIVCPKKKFQKTLLRPWLSALKKDGEAQELDLESLDDRDTV